MNPDYYPTHKSAHSTTWTIKKGAKVVSFKVYNNSSKVCITGSGAGYDGENKTYLITAARNMWNEYMRQGFRVINKCIDHDMKKFYKYKREEELDGYDVPEYGELHSARMSLDKYVKTMMSE